MGVEYELKFQADPDSQDAVRQAVAGEETVYDLQTTYYDTPSGAMSGRRYTLRRRLENAVSVCALKIPEEGAGRGEWEVCCESIYDAIDRLCQLGAPADLKELVAEGIVPVCGAKFTRIAKTVVLEDCTLELALDRGVLIGGGKEVPLCEIEVELKAGTREACNRYAGMLAAKFHLEQERLSKFRRALALYKGE